MELDEETFGAWRAYMDELVQPDGVPRHQQLRHGYARQQYLHTAPWEVVEERIRDILVNLSVITQNKKTGLPTINAEAEAWMTLLTHADVERGLRFGRHRGAGLREGFLRGTPIPRSTHPFADRAVEMLRKLTLPTAPYLVKLGKREHVREALEEGRILVSNAKRYDDGSLNPAIRDDELAATIHIVPEVPPWPSLPEDVIIAARPTTQFVKGVTAQALTDYYVYCMCTTLAPRLFVDFNYDACIVITQPEVFQARLLAAMEAKFPGWTIYTREVIYVDPFLGPLTSKSTLLGPYFHKQFRYAYQSEFRLIWIPPVPTERLQPIKLALGSLRECCQLVELA